MALSTTRVFSTTGCGGNPRAADLEVTAESISPRCRSLPSPSAHHVAQVEQPAVLLGADMVPPAAPR